jgi:putative inorganic carbon (HCO3(-)) transporter
LRTERLTRTATAPAGIAFGGLIAFIFIVYANPGNWFEGLEDIGFAKIAAGFSLVALMGSWLLYNRRLTVGGIQGWTLLALFSLVGLSASWSYWPKYTFDTFADGLKYLAVFFLVANVVDSESRLATFVRVLALASCIPAVGAIWSHAHGEHLVEGDRASWIGIFANPNDLAYHLVVGVAMLLAAANAAKTTQRKIAWWLLLAPVFYGILLTQSRGGMLAASVVCLFWALRSVKRAPLIVGAACVAAALVFISPNNPWSRRTQTATAYGEDVSARGRIDAWRTGVAIAKERPFTGVGAGAFMIAWPEFAPGDAGEVRTQHNTFIQLLSELGIPALFLFVGALLAGVLGMRRSAKTPSSLLPFTRGVQCGLAGFVVCSIFGGIAWTWPIYLLLGLAFAVRHIAAVGAPAGVRRAVTEDTVVEPMPHPVPALVGR